MINKIVFFFFCLLQPENHASGWCPWSRSGEGVVAQPARLKESVRVVRAEVERSKPDRGRRGWAAHWSSRAVLQWDAS